MINKNLFICLFIGLTVFRCAKEDISESKTLDPAEDSTIVAIEDDGDGYPNDILSKIGEPYLRSTKSFDKEKKGLGLGLFIGKTLLEKNLASVNCSNSETRSGAEVIIKWNNKDLFNL